MPVAVSTSTIRTTPSVASLKAEIKNRHILQRSSSRDSLRNLEQKLADPKILQKYYNIYLKRNMLHLFYYRFQLITGSYMLSSWESGIFSTSDNGLNLVLTL
jgi:hypothetical protein